MFICSGEINFSKAFQEELFDWFCKNIELPPGIAKMQAFFLPHTHTPLIIVGAPGSSKTLSFNLAIANLKGPESLFRKVKAWILNALFEQHQTR